jgi:hypothetical protein
LQAPRQAANSPRLQLISQRKLKARAIGGRTIVEAQSIREFFESCPPAPIGQKQQAA